MSFSYQRTSMRIQVYERQEASIRCYHLPYIGTFFFLISKNLASLDNGSCLRVKESTCPFVMKK